MCIRDRVEVVLFSQPDRRYYISTRYHEQVDWKLKVRSTVLAGKPFGRQLAKDLIDDIRKGIGEGRKSSPIGDAYKRQPACPADCNPG